jgi:hypothetical protein
MKTEEQRERDDRGDQIEERPEVQESFSRGADEVSEVANDEEEPPLE